MLAYLSLLNLFYDLRFLSLSYSENVFRIETMIFSHAKRKQLYFQRLKKTSDSRKYLCVRLASYDISGKFWDLTEHPLQQDTGFPKYHIGQNGATYANANELLCTCHRLPRGGWGGPPG